MPDYPNSESDLHSSLTANPPAIGKGTYTQSVSSPSQVSTQQRKDMSLRGAAKKQQIKSVTPGQEVAGKPSIKGRTSFSDEMGD